MRRPMRLTLCVACLALTMTACVARNASYGDGRGYRSGYDYDRHDRDVYLIDAHPDRDRRDRDRDKDRPGRRPDKDKPGYLHGGKGKDKPAGLHNGGKRPDKDRPGYQGGKRPGRDRPGYQNSGKRPDRPAYQGDRRPNRERPSYRSGGKRPQRSEGGISSRRGGGRSRR